MGIGELIFFVFFVVVCYSIFKLVNKTQGQATKKGIKNPAPDLPDSLSDAVNHRMNQATQQEQWTKQNLMEVAKYQKNIQWLVLANLVAMFIPGATIVTGIIGIYFIYKLADALRSSAAWVYIIFSFIPLVGLIALLQINGKATETLQDNGIKVGLMGARMADFDKIQENNDTDQSGERGKA